MGIFALKIDTSKKDVVTLDKIPCICSSIWFKNNKICNEVQMIINLGSNDNTLILRYTLKLSLKVCYLNLRVKKIDDFIFKMFEIFFTSFLIENKLEKT